MAAELALDALLGGEALVGKLGDKAGRHNGERRHEHHDDGHGDRNREHEDERAHDGDDARKEVGETLEQAIAHLVDVIDHARDEVAMRVAVDERKWHAADLLARLNAHVAHRAVRQAVDAVALQPLRCRRGRHHGGKLDGKRKQRGKVDAAGADDKVDGTPDLNGDEKLQDDRHGGGCKR